MPDVADTLNNLGILYRATQRLQEAEAAYTECLTIRQQLVQANPDNPLVLNGVVLGDVAHRKSPRRPQGGRACDKGK
jgi:hypothetical protein